MTGQDYSKGTMPLEAIRLTDEILRLKAVLIRIIETQEQADEMNSHGSSKVWKVGDEYFIWRRL